MGDLFDFFQQHKTGIFVLLIALVAVSFLFLWSCQKVLWLFGWGRFQQARVPGVSQPGSSAAAVSGAPVESSLGVVITAFFAKLIDEFRHLLALLIFLLFAGVLIYGVAVAGGDGQAHIDNIEKVIQVVVASLGGLVGSIMGYYFGEASGKTTPPTPQQQVNPASQGPSSNVSAVAPPPPLDNQDNPQPAPKPQPDPASQVPLNVTPAVPPAPDQAPPPQ